MLAIPIYLFIFSIAVLIISGGIKFLTGGMEAAAPEFGTSLSHVSIFLLLKAFSSGCSALTGVEAVSNAIPNFKQPAEKNAAGTLMLGMHSRGYVYRDHLARLRLRSEAGSPCYGHFTDC